MHRKLPFSGGIKASKNQFWCVKKVVWGCGAGGAYTLGYSTFVISVALFDLLFYYASCFAVLCLFAVVPLQQEEAGMKAAATAAEAAVVF